ncbi:MAG: winged helix-turn-helix domain-containing protein [Candidatus Thermoplasmatota archaeon]|nr:winged helix-turn-helix domain-containing protein [Candidatus Thermoplasmatota archaeon]
MSENEKMIENWANKFPFGIKELAKGLSNDKRLAITSLLMENEDLSFSQIRDYLQLDNNILGQHLNVLLDNGIIRRTKSKWANEEKIFKSKYKLNTIYRRILNENINFLKKPTGKIAIMAESYNLYRKSASEMRNVRNYLFNKDRMVEPVTYSKVDLQVGRGIFGGNRGWEIKRTLK